MQSILFLNKLKCCESSAMKKLPLPICVFCFNANLADLHVTGH